MTDENQQPGSGQADPKTGPEVGTVAEEAAQLFAALGGWAKRQGGDYAGAATSAAGTAEDMARSFGEHIATGTEECRYCPVCQAISLVRATSPEVKAHLLVAANSLVQAAAGLLATQTPADPSGPRVQKIDLEDESGDWNQPT